MCELKEAAGEPERADKQPFLSPAQLNYYYYY